jgi:hypothetical protein
LLVLVQPSVVCACAVEHAFFCGEGPEESHRHNGIDPAAAGQPRDASPCAAAGAASREHHPHAACANAESLRVAHKVLCDLGMPALPAFARGGLLDSSVPSARADLRVTPAQPPPGSDRRVPLLN